MDMTNDRVTYLNINTFESFLLLVPFFSIIQLIQFQWLYEVRLSWTVTAQDKFRGLEKKGPCLFIVRKVRPGCITTFEYNEIFESNRGKKEAYPGQWTVQDRRKYSNTYLFNV